MKIYLQMEGEELVELVPLGTYHAIKRQLDITRADVAELNDRLQERTQDYLTTMQDLRAENRKLASMLRRLHRAISVRMSADEPTNEERLELMHAWQEAAAILDQTAAITVTPNTADATIKAQSVMIEKLANALALITEEYEDRRFQFGDEYLWQKHEGNNPLPTAFAALEAYESLKGEQP